MARPGPPGRLGSGAVPGWAKGLSPLPLSLGRPWHMGFLIARYPIDFSFYHGFFPCQGLPAGNFPWAPSPPLCQGGPAARCAAGPSGAFPLFPRGEDAVFRYSRPNAFWVSARASSMRESTSWMSCSEMTAAGSNRMVLALTKVPAVSTFRANMPLAHA